MTSGNSNPEAHARARSQAPQLSRRDRVALRHPAALILAGILCLFIAPSGTEAEGWALFTGAGLAVLLLNVLHRIGVEGDSDRDKEDDARAYFSEPGHWPGEGPTPRA